MWPCRMRRTGGTWQARCISNAARACSRRQHSHSAKAGYSHHRRQQVVREHIQGRCCLLGAPSSPPCTRRHGLHDGRPRGRGGRVGGSGRPAAAAQAKGCPATTGVFKGRRIATLG